MKKQASTAPSAAAPDIHVRVVADALERHLSAIPNGYVSWVQAAGEVSFEAPKAVWPRGAEFGYRIEPGVNEGVHVFVTQMTDDGQHSPLVDIKLLCEQPKSALNDLSAIMGFIGSLDLHALREHGGMYRSGAPAAQRLEAGDKVFVVAEKRLGTVLDVYGDGVAGDHGDIRVDLCGNIQISEVELYDPSRHSAYDSTFIPIKAEWKERYGITKDVELRVEPVAATEESAADQPSAASEWTPIFTPWRHGGWYVSNVRYANGACGCVSDNYPDGKWRIVTDKNRVGLGDGTDITFPDRDAAARAERDMAIHEHCVLAVTQEGDDDEPVLRERSRG